MVRELEPERIRVMVDSEKKFLAYIAFT